MYVQLDIEKNPCDVCLVHHLHLSYRAQCLEYSRPSKIFVGFINKWLNEWLFLGSRITVGFFFLFAHLHVPVILIFSFFYNEHVFLTENVSNLTSANKYINKWIKWSLGSLVIGRFQTWAAWTGCAWLRCLGSDGRRNRSPHPRSQRLHQPAFSVFLWPTRHRFFALVCLLGESKKQVPKVFFKDCKWFIGSSQTLAVFTLLHWRWCRFHALPAPPNSPWTLRGDPLL